MLPTKSLRKQVWEPSNYVDYFINSFIQTISIAPLQIHYCSEALPTQHGYCAGISRQSATGNCEWRLCPRSLHWGYSGSQTHDPSDERCQLYQCATHAPHERHQLYQCATHAPQICTQVQRSKWRVDRMATHTLAVKKTNEWNPMAGEEEWMERHLDMEGKWKGDGHQHGW